MLRRHANDLRVLCRLVTNHMSFVKYEPEPVALLKCAAVILVVSLISLFELY